MFKKTALSLCLAFPLVLAGCGEPKPDHSSPNKEEKQDNSTARETQITPPPPAPLTPPDTPDTSATSATPDTPATSDTPLPPPLSAFFAGGKTPDASLIPGNLPDIGGIRIGEPLDSSLITKLNPDYRIDRYTTKNRETGNERVTGIRAEAEGDRLMVMWNEAGLVWYVGREVTPKVEERFMHDTLITSLIEKYGQILFEKSRIVMATVFKDIYWGYDREGKPVSGKTSSFCGGAVNPDRIEIPSKFPQHCGYAIAAGIMNEGNLESTVRQYRISISYVKPVFDELLFKQKEKELAYQQKREEEIRRAQQNKPKL